MEQRQKVGGRYTARLSENANIDTPYIEPHSTSVYAQYSILVNNRDAVAKHINGQGIPTAIHYPAPLNQQPGYKQISGGGETPISDDIARRVMSLPMGPDLTQAEQDRIIAALLDVTGNGV